MEVRQLKIFAKAAETLNFSEASKQFYITQSTLTQTIKQLEDELGVKLFDRNSHEVYLTEAGSELLAHVDSVISEIEECKARILDLSNLRRGKLSIGVTHSFAMLNTEVVAEFCELYPQIKIEIVYKCMGELLLMLQRHELDYVLSYKPSYEMPQIDSEVLFHDRLGVIVRRDHPLAERKSVSIRELDQYGLVLPAKGMQTRNVLDRILDKQDVQLKTRVEMNNVTTMMRLVRGSKMLTFASCTSTGNYPDLVAVPLEDEGSEMIGCFHTLKGTYRKQAVEEMQDIIKRYIYCYGLE